jgi:hypothetical protein
MANSWRGARALRDRRERRQGEERQRYPRMAEEPAADEGNAIENEVRWQVRGRDGVNGLKLTRSGIASTQSANLPVMAAEELLKAVVAKAGEVPPDEGITMLSKQIELARSVGVSETMPNMKMAKALLSALECASEDGCDTESLLEEDEESEESRAAKLNAIFDGGFAAPDDDFSWDDDDS